GSARAKMVRPYMTERGMRIVAALDEVAERVGGGATPARVAIAWLIHRPGITAPIVSATSERQFTELVEATRLELSAEDLRRLDEASAWNGDCRRSRARVSGCAGRLRPRAGVRADRGGRGWDDLAGGA